MTDNVENLVLEQLRAIRGDIASVKDDTREIKSRLTSVEHAVAALRKEAAGNYGDIVDTHERYDRLADRIEKIERRLEISSS